MIAFQFLWVKRLKKLWRLSHLERGLLLQAILLLPLFHLALRLLGYARLRGALASMTPICAGSRPLSSTQRVRRVKQITRIVTIASQRGLYKATCLRRSLLTWWLLRGEGIASDICLGVRTPGGILEAHAWVEYEGIVLNDRPDVRQKFQVLQDTLPSTSVGL
jgi:hypothetical protein